MEENKKNNDIVYFGETNFRRYRQKFGIKLDDRRRHMYLIGKTGMGKTTTMENMVYQDICAGRGVALVDPHGDFVEKILDYIPPHRIKDVVYFNPADLQYPLAFNILESLQPETKHIAASGLIGIFKKLWADTWGPRLEYLLRNAILALMDYPNSTILGVMRMLVDKKYRQRIVAKVQDPMVRSFWEDEFTKYTASFQVEAINPIQNKVGQFVSTPLIRNIIGQVKSSFDIKEIMDNQKILLMNLSKGRIGEDASALLGAMMITKIQLAAMERVNMPEEQRKDFFLYVDEFQNFATESFANILSEARKYRLDLIIAHQYIEQLDDTVRAAIFGNVGTLVVFRVGAADAEFLEKEFSPQFTQEDLVNLTRFNFYIKLMIDGLVSEPFSARSLPPLAKRTGSAERVIALSRERYASQREEVEEKIKKWFAQGKQIEAEVKAESLSEEEKEKLGLVHCSYCNGLAEVAFQPDGKRPVFCDDCLKKIRSQEIIIKKDENGVYWLIKDEGHFQGKDNILKIPSEEKKRELEGSFQKKKTEEKPQPSAENLSANKEQGKSATSLPDQPEKDLSSQQKNSQQDNDRRLKPGEVIKF